MDADRLNYFKDRLIEKRRTLTDMVSKNEEYGREKDQNILDIADMAVESYTKEFLFGKSAGDRQLLLMIHGALNRIEDRTYGNCVHCENSIQPKRLEAVPWTSHCILCQELIEKGLLEESE